MQRLDSETETFVPSGGSFDDENLGVAATLNASGAGTNRPAGQGNELDFLVAHSLRADGFDASEDGTGRGTPLIPIDMRQASRGGTMTNNRPGGNSGGAPGTGIGKNGDPAFSVTERGQAIAFGWQNSAAQGASASAKHTPTLDKSKTPAVSIGMAVRRLTPRECERLQGFPATREVIRLDVCLDLPNNAARVALSCRRWLDSASTAAADWSYPSAGSAEGRSDTSQADHVPLAVVSVRTESVDGLHEIRSRGKLTWSAVSADASGESRQPTPIASIARLLAPLGRDLAQEIRVGKAESLVNIRLSIRAEPGELRALACGVANVVYANGADSAAKPERCITALLGSLAPTSDSPIATSVCSALAAISGCIPSETPPERFSIELAVDTPYTLVTYRKKPAADGPRYKALGNSMAINVVRWIGQRIQAVENITNGKNARRSA